MMEAEGYQMVQREITEQKRTTLFRAYLKLIRPKQWVKNLFVFAPLIFAKELFQPDSFLIDLRAFIAFCATASAVYIINDIADVEADRAHPEKKHRPLAARTLSVGRAYLLLSILLVVAAAFTIGLDIRFAVLLASYFAVNIAYSFKLKEVVLLDVFTIAAGFMLRVLGGAYAIDVRVSSWLVLCTLFISLFLGFAKRRGELIASQEAGTISERKVLLSYRVGIIDQLLTIAAAGTVISYALYTVSARTIETFGTDKMIYTTVFVIYGIFRYLYLVHMTSSTENPTNALTSDIPIIGTALLWVISCIFLIYSGGQIPLISR